MSSFGAVLSIFFSFCPAEPPAQCRVRVRVKRRYLRRRAVVFCHCSISPCRRPPQSRAGRRPVYGSVCLLLCFVCCIVEMIFYALGCMQATFFTTYVLSSSWASLAVEVMQIFPLLCNLFQRFILRLKEDALDGNLSFPYHTEVPRILLFGFLGFTCAILAPLMLPFLLIYFFIAYLVYRN